MSRVLIVVFGLTSTLTLSTMLIPIPGLPVPFTLTIFPVKVCFFPDRKTVIDTFCPIFCFCR
ncbi:Putative uncharacterized protein [Lactobacillus delbrueckii subsp. lactis]|nr:Putative uncharacterized protein [Lactobacillus delbrueckii subsp. lactis]